MKSPFLLALAVVVGASTAARAAEPVVWTNAVGVTVTGNSLTRGAAAAGWTAGASSVGVIRDGYGYVECTALETNTRRACGLSFGDTNQSNTDIDFAIQAYETGAIQIWEGSSQIAGSYGTYASGDRLRVEVAHGSVRYLRNGALLYASAARAQYPLRVDTALYSPGATLNDVVVGSVGWANAVGVAVARDIITKTGAAGWNSGVASANQIASGDGYVEFTAGQNTTGRAAGLANGDAGQTLADIEYAIHLRADGMVTVSESGSSAGDFGGYIGSDRFRVELRGGTVRYLKNGALFYTSAVAPVYPLRADTAFDTAGGTLEDVRVETLVWTSAAGVAMNGATLVKTAGSGWNAGAAASNAIASGDGWLEATAIETNTQRAFGLESGGAATTLSDLDHAIELTETGTVKVHESGVIRGTFGSYANGDLLRVEVRDGIVRYLRNGTLLYTSAVVPSYPLHADTALFTTGATLHHVTTGDVVWLDDVGVEIRGNRLAKTAALAWGNAAAFSTRAINSGFVEIVVAEKNTSRMIGLSHGNVSSSFTDIDYALYLRNDAALYVYENNVQKGPFGAYASGDRLKVRLQSGVVTYLRNDVVFYTSLVAPILPLRLDAALSETGGTISGLTYPGAAAVDTLDAPLITPGTATYTAAQNVTMAALAGATIRYTTNGSEPDGGSTLYSGPVSVNTYTLVKARAFKSGYNESATATRPTRSTTATFSPPTLTPTQTFVTSGSVTMSAQAGRDHLLHDERDRSHLVVDSVHRSRHGRRHHDHPRQGFQARLDDEPDRDRDLHGEGRDARHRPGQRHARRRGADHGHASDARSHRQLHDERRGPDESRDDPGCDRVGGNGLRGQLHAEGARVQGGPDCERRRDRDVQRDGRRRRRDRSRRVRSTLSLPSRTARCGVGERAARARRERARRSRPFISRRPPSASPASSRSPREKPSASRSARTDKSTGSEPEAVASWGSALRARATRRPCCH